MRMCGSFGSRRGPSGAHLQGGGPRAGEPTAEIDLEDLRAHVAERLPRFPRLRRRLASTPLGLANPAWVDDPDFDVARHVVAHGSGGGVARRDLPGIVAELMTLRLDRDRPLWRMDVAGPFEDGGAALVSASITAWPTG